MKLKIHTLEEKPEYKKQTISLLEEAFHYNNENSIETDFNLLLNKVNDNNCFILLSESKELIGHIGVLKRDIYINKKKYTLTFFGCIVISEKYRGKKLFRPFFQNILEKFADSSLHILWSDKNYIYNKFDFFEAGRIIQTSSNLSLNPIIDGYEKTYFKKLSKLEFSQVKELYKNQWNTSHNKFISPQRDLNEWELIKDIDSINLYIKKMGNKISSYFCVNKGMDLSGVIHEYCSNEKNNHQEQELSEYCLWTPKESLLKINSSILYAAFYKVGNKIKFSELVSSMTNDLISIKEITKESIIYDYNNNTLKTSHDIFLNKILDPSVSDGKTLYFSGIDSI